MSTTVQKYHNPNCDGAHCQSVNGYVAVLPYSADGNLILCYDCYLNEMIFRRDRNSESGRKLFDLPNWDDLKIYE